MIVEKFSIHIENLLCCLKDYYYEKRHYVLCCKKCSRLLVPTVEHVGPNNCGWVYCTGWICHQCESHGALEGTKEEVANYLQLVEARNEKIRWKMKKYKLSHPWVKFRKK